MEGENRTGALFDPYCARDLPLYSEAQISNIQSLSQDSASQASSQTLTKGSPNEFIIPNPPPVYHQLNIGSCVANACCAALRHAYVVGYLGREDEEAYREFKPSRLFAYYWARLIPLLPEPNNFEPLFNWENKEVDKGTCNRACLFVLINRGIRTEDDKIEGSWPYGIPKSDKTTRTFNTEATPNPTDPGDREMLSGDQDMIPHGIGYYRIFDPSEPPPPVDPLTKMPISAYTFQTSPSIKLLEHTLREGHPFIFSSMVFETANFENLEPQMKNGMYFKPEAAGKLVWKSGHAMLAVGYNSDKRAFLVQNSWGDYYRNQRVDESFGRFWMPYEWFELIYDDGIERGPVIRDYWVVKYKKDD